MANTNEQLEKDATAPKQAKSKYILTMNVGSNKDGSPKKKKGSSVLLTEDEARKYKQLNLI